MAKEEFGKIISDGQELKSDVQGGTPKEKTEIREQYAEETVKADERSERVKDIADKQTKIEDYQEERRIKTEDKADRLVKESKEKVDTPEVKAKRAEYLKRLDNYKKSKEKQEKEIEKNMSQTIKFAQDETKYMDEMKRNLEAKMSLRETVKSQLIGLHRDARGEIQPMQVSAEGLKNKLNNPPEMQEAPEFKPETGRMIAQLAGSIVAQLGPRSSAVKSPFAVGMDAMNKDNVRNIASHESQLQAVAKKNDDLMLKYDNDIQGLFKEYDKESNKNVREYARMQLKLDEIELSKDRMQLDAKKFNALSKQDAKKFNARMAMENKKIVMRQRVANAKSNDMQRKQVYNLVGGEKMFNRATGLYATQNPQAANTMMYTFDKMAENPGLTKRNMPAAQGYANQAVLALNKIEDKNLRNRASVALGGILQSGLSVDVDNLMPFLTKNPTYVVSTLEKMLNKEQLVTDVEKEIFAKALIPYNEKTTDLESYKNFAYTANTLTQGILAKQFYMDEVDADWWDPNTERVLPKP